MTEGNEPEGATAKPQAGHEITAQPPAEAFDLASLPIVSKRLEEPKPGGPPRLTPERYAAEARRLDRLLVLLVVVFAGFVASFVARNSDVWLHLATGRALAQGQYTFGVDPFSYTTGGVYWANHSWLYDLTLYGTAEASGGMDHPTARALLVAVKALLVALLAGVLLGIRRHDQSVWVPATCTALALLVMSPRLLLHPTIGSFLLFGLTLYFLARDGKPAPTSETRGWRLLFTSAPARLYALPVLFLLWVNLDSWFLLGPLTLALYILGEALERSYIRPARADSEIRVLVIVWMIGLLACLVNPHHYRAFAVPPEALPSVFLAPLRSDATFVGLFVTPFTKGYWSNAIGGNAAGYAYFALLGISLFSFGLNLGELRLWRVTLWLAFASLSVLNVRGVPFFAVAAGPIAALNLQDFAARRFGVDAPAGDPGRLWGLGGRFATVLGLFTLLALAWPGWLQPYSADPALARRVQWGVEVNPALRQTAEQLCAWRKQGLLPAESHSFHFSPEAANYCAWFCPAEKGFVDYRYALFGNHLSDYVAVRKALRLEDPAAGPVWRPFFARHKIDRVILNGVPERTLVAMLFDSNEWTLLSLDGRSAVFGWHDPDAAADPLAKLRFDLTERAFGAGADRAPAEGPGRPPHRPTGWERYLDPPPSRSLDADLAYMLTELYYKPLVQREGEALTAQRRAWLNSTFFSLVGWGASGDPMATGVNLMQRASLGDYLFAVAVGREDLGLPAAPLVALRAARRAVAAQPDVGRGYAGLARSADLLWRAQENPWAGLAGPTPIQPQQLAQFRQVLAQRRQSIEPFLSAWIKRSVTPRQLVRQMTEVWAWQQALALDDERRHAHEALASVYWQMGYYDLAVEHFRSYVAARKAAGPVAGEERKQFDETIQNLEKGVQLLDKTVQELRTDFELAAANQPPTARAGLAHVHGLAKEAVRLLEQADLSKFNRDEADFLIYLYLTTGQFEKLNPNSNLGVLADNLQAPLGVLYQRNQALLAAATGAYGTAATALDKLLSELPRDLPQLAANYLANALFDRLQSPSAARLAFLDANVRNHFQEVQNTLLGLLREEGELRVLRGLIALEEGDIAAARRQFQQALSIQVPFESRPIAARYLKLLEGSSK